MFEAYGNYMDNNYSMCKWFKINLCLKHILATNKICDLNSTNFGAALELDGQNECTVFLFTDSHSKDFSFVMCASNISFTPDEFS